MDPDNRIVVLIDMDCFYVQCEQRLEPDKWQKPCVVAQYNNWKGGGIIAVNYEARAFGIKRGMRGDQAKELCPDVHIFSVPDENGKAKLDKYRDASAEVFQVISDFLKDQQKMIGSSDDLVILERASIDEAFIDLTKLIDAIKQSITPNLDMMITKFQTKLEFENQSIDDWFNQLNQDDDYRLIVAANLIGKLREKILIETKFKCSAGISHNKMLSKLACGLNKPNAQTILPMNAVELLFKRIKIRDVRLLGGKLGQQIREIFHIETMYELRQLSRSILMDIFDTKTTEWLCNLAQGIDHEPVADRRLSKSLGCGKNFRGKMLLKKISDIKHWINALLKELLERMLKDLNQNQRIAKLMIVGYQTSAKGHCHRSITIQSESGGSSYPSLERLSQEIMRQVFSDSNQNIIENDPLLNLSLAATKFIDLTTNDDNDKIEQFFTKIDRDAFIKQQPHQHQQQPQINQINQGNTTTKKRPKNSNTNKGLVKKAKIVQTNTMDRYLMSSKTIRNDNNNNDDKIDLNDPYIREINREFDQLLDSFFFQKILLMLENNEWKH